MIPMTQTLLVTLGAIVVAMIAMWTISLIRRDASIVDPFWGTGFVLTAWLVLMLNQPATSRVGLLAGMTTIWGTRLFLFLFLRNRGHGEDRRYVAMREKHGQQFWWVSLFTVFLLQGLIMWIVAVPLQATAAIASANPIGWLDILGVSVWSVGLFFESVGDWQLARFKANPANSGRVMDRGLWRFTRHPNYFGDFCIWWGIYLVAASGGAGWTIFSPLLMTILLMKVSGVTLLESTIINRRPEYSAYCQRTNAFFPGPPK